MTRTTVQIKQLSASVINKIAAGEVIERPASVVKELMENSIDAGATRIDVSIEKGGVDLIRIADNGHGIEKDQLPLAVTSHATSKIDEAEDLFQVGSLGFRGEALASVAEISRFLLRSRVSGEGSGYEMEVIGGSASEIAPCGAPVGTTIEVRDLFFNTPVRRRFLKTTQTEIGHISEAFTRIALGFPQVHFTLSHNNRMLHELPVSHDLRDRIGRFFGPEIQSALIPVSSENDGVTLHGFVVDPTHSRSHKRMQYLFLNGRHIRDRSLQHALTESYRGLLLHGRSPIAFLRMEMPADLIDVNVHPAKLEVRFQNGGQLYSQLLGTIRKMFLSTDLTAKVDPRIAEQSQKPDAAHGTNQQNNPQQNAAGGALAAPDPASQRSMDFKPFPSLVDPFAIGANQSATLSDAETNRAHRFDEPSGIWKPSSDPLASHESMQHSASNANAAHFEIPSTANLASPSPADAENSMVDVSKIGLNRSLTGTRTVSALGIQIHNRYLVSETEEGVIVIDQHALHERILYEEIRTKVLGGKLECQKLLVPETVHLSSTEAASVLEQQELLQQLGMQIEPFGGDTVLISSYPAMLKKVAPAEMLRQVVDLLAEGGKTPEPRDLLDSLLHMISCKAAIKAGDHLSAEEVSMLIEHRHYCQDSHHCPHGRPTALVFSREELDRRFKRI